MKNYCLLIAILFAFTAAKSQVLPNDSALYFQTKFFESGLENEKFFTATEKQLLQKYKADSTSKETNCNLYRLYFHTSTHMYAVIADTSQNGIKKFNSFPFVVQKTYGDSLTNMKLKALNYMQKCSGYGAGYEFEDN